MNEYKEMTKHYLATYTDALRADRKLTQERMAEELRISSRAYGDLERGKYCFSSNALLFMMVMLERDEIASFLCGFQTQVEMLEHGANYENG